MTREKFKLIKLTPAQRAKTLDALFRAYFDVSGVYFAKKTTRPRLEEQIRMSLYSMSAVANIYMDLLRALEEEKPFKKRKTKRRAI